MLQKANIQNIRVWSKKSLLIEKASAQEDGALKIPQVLLKRAQNSGFFLYQEKGEWAGQELHVTSAPTGIQGRVQNL